MFNIFHKVVQQHVLCAVGNKDLVGSLAVVSLCAQLTRDLLAIAKFFVVNKECGRRVRPTRYAPARL